MKQPLCSLKFSVTCIHSYDTRFTWLTTTTEEIFKSIIIVRITKGLSLFSLVLDARLTLVFRHLFVPQ